MDPSQNDELYPIAVLIDELKVDLPNSSSHVVVADVISSTMMLGYV